MSKLKFQMNDQYQMTKTLWIGDGEGDEARIGEGDGNVNAP